MIDEQNEKTMPSMYHIPKCLHIARLLYFIILTVYVTGNGCTESESGKESGRKITSDRVPPVNHNTSQDAPDAYMPDSRDKELIIQVAPLGLLSIFAYSKHEKAWHITLEVSLEGPWRAVVSLWGELVHIAHNDPAQLIEIENPSGQVIQFSKPLEERLGMEGMRVEVSPEEMRSFPFEYKGDEITRIILPMRLATPHEIRPGFYRVRLKPDGLPSTLSFNEHYDQSSVNVQVHINEPWHGNELIQENSE